MVHDAQTSGGLLMSASPDLAGRVIKELNTSDPAGEACIIGEVLTESPRRLYFE